MRWLLLKDLRILRRSPLMVALLVIYPIVIAVLIGFALSRGPDKPKVAFYNGLPVSASTLELGGHKLNLADEEGQLFKDVDVVKADSPQDVEQKVRDGDVLAGIVIPKDLAANLQSTLESGKLKVFYNSEDPAKQAFVENTIEAQVKAANAALTKRIAQEALRLLNLIGDGGTYQFLGQDFNVLGLKRTQAILEDARQSLPPAKRKELDEVIDFTDLARDNLSFSDDVLNVVGEPIKVSATSLKGGSTSLDEFAVALAAAVSLMFITLLLAAGMLAIEREENAFPRLVRGLVSRSGLLAEKAGLAAVCSTAVCLLMLIGLGLFVEPRLGSLRALGGGDGRGRAGVRDRRPRDRDAHARGARGLAAGIHAGAAAGVPGAGALRGGGAGPLRPDSSRVRAVPVQADARRPRRGAQRRRRAWEPRCSTWPRSCWRSARSRDWRCGASP